VAPKNPLESATIMLHFGIFLSKMQLKNSLHSLKIYDTVLSTFKGAKKHERI